MYRRFFYEKSWSILVLSVFFCFIVVRNVYAADNGSLTLNPTIITNDDTQVGSSGDFLIRGQLFSDELNQIAKNNKETQENLIKQVKKIDFENADTKNQEKIAVPQNLFQNYHPQVIPSKENSATNNNQSTILFSIFGGIVLIIMGSFVGRTWTRRRK